MQTTNIVTPPYPEGQDRAEVINAWLEHIDTVKSALLNWRAFLFAALDKDPAKVDTNKVIALERKAYHECEDLMAALETLELAKLEQALTGRHHLSLYAKQVVEEQGFKTLVPFLETIVQEYPEEGEQLLAMLGGMQ